MKKKFDFVSAKKYAENLNTEDDILNIKKDKLLSLRKKNNKKIKFNRIFEQKEIEETKKYSIYEFQESDFKNILNKKDISELPLENKNNNIYENEEFKCILYCIV